MLEIKQKQRRLIDIALAEQMNENNKKINNSDDFDFYRQSFNKIHGVRVFTWVNWNM